MSLRAVHILGIIGAVVVFVATAITWYTHDISVAAQTGQVGFTSSKAYTLWDFTTLAPVLLVIAAAVAAILAFAPASGARGAGCAAALLGLAVVAYCLVRVFDFPDLGVTGAASLPFGAGINAHASTTLGAGPLIGVLGGALLCASGLGLASEEATVPDRHTASSAAATAS